MASAIHLIKVIGAWALCVAATVCLFVAQPLALPLFVGSIAFSQLPE